MLLERRDDITKFGMNSGAVIALVVILDNDLPVCGDMVFDASSDAQVRQRVALHTIRGGTDFTSEVYEIAGLFDQARAYATANNTYVLAGIDEVSSAAAARPTKSFFFRSTKRPRPAS